jgi:hypothetical protein
VNVDLPAQNWTDPNVGTVLKMYKEFQVSVVAGYNIVFLGQIL